MCEGKLSLILDSSFFSFIWVDWDQENMLDQCDVKVSEAHNEIHMWSIYLDCEVQILQHSWDVLIKVKVKILHLFQFSNRILDFEGENSLKSHSIYLLTQILKNLFRFEYSV